MDTVKNELCEIQKRLNWITEHHNFDRGIYLDEANKLMDRRDVLWGVLYGKS